MSVRVTTARHIITVNIYICFIFYFIIVNKLTMNILIKQLRSAVRVWSDAMRDGRGTEKSPLKMNTILRSKFSVDIINEMNKSRNKKQIPNGNSSKKHTVFRNVGNEICHILQSSRNSI
jgi:hypothetical protein